jgi:hypothetical protein
VRVPSVLRKASIGQSAFSGMRRADCSNVQTWEHLNRTLCLRRLLAPRFRDAAIDGAVDWRVWLR